MKEVTLILLCAGTGSRFGEGVRKQWLYTGEKPLWLHVADDLNAKEKFFETIIVGHPDDCTLMRRFCSYKVTEGGSERQESLTLALEHVKTPYVLVSDVARAHIPASMLSRIMNDGSEADCVIPVLDVVDTTLFHNEPIERQALRLVQTPQLSVTISLRKALETSTLFTDDSSAIRALGGKITEVKGSRKALKITYKSDLKRLKLSPAALLSLQGNGFDVHPFEEGKIMRLGGVTIPSSVGFKAHSDGDVAIHALIDAILGAAGMGDIGELFPDTDMLYHNIDSTKLLEIVIIRIREIGLRLTHADITIIAQKPRLGGYKEGMRHALAKICHLTPARLNVKATTTEKLGFTGREEGVAVIATATLLPIDWREL